MVHTLAGGTPLSAAPAAWIFVVLCGITWKTFPWMFIVNHYHYARWMTVCVRGLLALENTCPTTHAQVHEQLNAMVKGNGYRIMGITKNEAALRHWMVAVQKRLACWMNMKTNIPWIKRTPNIIMHRYPMHIPTSHRSRVSLMWSKNSPIHVLINIHIYTHLKPKW